jgi:D-cysteine desulfhydrase
MTGAARPALDQRLSLVTGITPVRMLPALSALAGRDVYVKQDDLTSPIYGGTKTRKLEYILHDAMAVCSGSLVTLGGWGSHHITATALHARSFGLQVNAVVAPQPNSRRVEAALRHSLAAGAILHPASGDLNAALCLWRLMRQLRRDGQRPYLVNLGGSSAWGCLGTVRGALELVEQERAGHAPLTASLVVALGSGSTAAGLALGFVLAGSPRPIHAVRATSAMVVNRFVIGRLIEGAAKLLLGSKEHRALVREACELIQFDTAMIGRGYGWPTDSGTAAMKTAQLDDLMLESTYTAKAMASLLGQSRHSTPTLYWHTLAAELPAPSANVKLPDWYKGGESG